MSIKTRPIRVLVAKPGLDGHDRGAKILATSLRDAGMEVIYTGLHQTPEMIVNSAIQEDVDIICVSILSGAHHRILTELIKLLTEKKALDIPVLAGGIIPEKDIGELKKAGVKEIFTAGSSLTAIIDYIKNCVNHAKIGSKP